MGGEGGCVEGRKVMGGTRVLRGEGAAEPSGALQGTGVLIVPVVGWSRCRAPRLHPIRLPLEKGTSHPPLCSPRHQMRGGAFSTLRQFLQPQLPGAVPLRDGVHVADRGGRGLLRPALLQPLRAGVPRRLRL